MSIFELKPKIEKDGNIEHEIVPALEREESSKDIFNELVNDLDWASKLLGDYQNESDEKLKAMRFDVLNEFFSGSKMEQRFAELEEGNDERISSQFLRMMDIKKIIESDWHLHEKKAA